MGILGEHKNRQKKHQRRLNKLWMILIGLVVIMAGVGLIVLSFDLGEWLPEEYGATAASTVMAVGQVAISVSITALLFEHFGYVDYTVKRVCDALAEDEVLNVLNGERKKELKNILFEDIYLGRQPAQDPKALVEQLSTDIGDLLNSYYFEEFHTSCDISMTIAQDGQRYFCKHVHRTITMRPIQQGRKCRASHLFFLRTNDIPAGTRDRCGNELRPVKFSRVSVNDRLLEQGKDYHLETSEDSDAGPYSINCELVLNNENLLEIGESLRVELVLNNENLLEIGESLRVELVYVTHVPSTDPLYSVTVNRPCKFFSCHINNSVPDHNLRIKSYGFMAFGNNRRRMHIETKSGVVVRFRSWILPGDGTVAVLTPKQSIPVCPIQGTPRGGGGFEDGMAEELETAGIL